MYVCEKADKRMFLTTYGHTLTQKIYLVGSSSIVNGPFTLTVFLLLSTVP